MNILQRLSSYVNWPRDVRSVSPVILANAGFLYSGHGDKVTCPVCHIELEGWLSNSLSHPRTEHITRSPECQLAKTCSESPIDLPVKQNKRPTDTKDHHSIAAAPDSLSNQQEQASAAAPHHNTSIFLTSATNIPLAADVFTSIDRRNPDFQRLKDAETRLFTYYDWPTTAHVTPEDLVANGFFYTGRDDRVQCAFCKGFLHNWVLGDEPASEHRRHFPRCPFVAETVTDNQKFVRKQTTSTAPVTSQRQMYYGDGERREGSDASSRDATCGQALKTGPGAATSHEGRQGASPDKACSADTDEETERLMAEHRLLMEARMCKVCMDKEIDTVFLPCGHLVSCHDCSPKLKHCAICRTYIRGTVKTFFS